LGVQGVPTYPPPLAGLSCLRRRNACGQVAIKCVHKQNNLKVDCIPLLRDRHSVRVRCVALRLQCQSISSPVDIANCTVGEGCTCTESLAAGDIPLAPQILLVRRSCPAGPQWAVWTDWHGRMEPAKSGTGTAVHVWPVPQACYGPRGQCLHSLRDLCR